MTKQNYFMNNWIRRIILQLWSFLIFRSLPLNYSLDTDWLTVLQRSICKGLAHRVVLLGIQKPLTGWEQEGGSKFTWNEESDPRFSSLYPCCCCFASWDRISSSHTVFYHTAKDDVQFMIVSCLCLRSAEIIGLRIAPCLVYVALGINPGQQSVLPAVGSTIQPMVYQRYTVRVWNPTIMSPSECVCVCVYVLQYSAVFTEAGHWLTKIWSYW